jgi:hypothetical protein
MIDMKNLRRSIEALPVGGCAAMVTRRWLQEVELELVTGNAALAELAAIRAERGAAA